MARTPRRRWRVTLGLIVTAVLAGSVLQSPPAWAHAELTFISPADGDVLAAPPRIIELAFSEPLIAAAATVVVTDDRGVVVTRDRSRVDASSVSVPWPVDLPPGDYTIAYRVVSGDGHPIKGTSRFTLRVAASPSLPTGSPQPEPGLSTAGEGRPTATPASTVSMASDRAVPPTVLPNLALSALILGGIALGFVLLMRRRRAP